MTKIKVEDVCAKEELTLKQIEQIDEFEGAVCDMVSTVLGIDFDGHDNDGDYQDLHDIMDSVVRIGGRHGIPEMQIYPYIEAETESK